MRIKGNHLLLVFLAIILFCYQIALLAIEIDANHFSVKSGTIDTVSFVLMAFSFFILVILVLVEINHLEDFNIDKFTLVTLLLSSFLQLITKETYSLILFGLISILLVFTLYVKKPKYPRTNRYWTLWGVAISSTIAVLITIYELHLLHILHIQTAVHVLQNSPTITAITFVAKQLLLVAMPEEVLFRGFIWGYLKRLGWAEIKVMWAQGILFWFMHLSRIVTPFTFFVSIPILTIISSQLTLRSKQVFPAIISHTIINAIGSLFSLAII